MNITELKQHWEAWRKSRKVAINSKLIEGIDALLADHESIAKQNAAMREALVNARVSINHLKEIDYGTATAGDYGTATAGNRGTATAGNRGTATAGYRGTATAGDYGTLQVKHWDDGASRYRIKTAYVGEGGILAGKKYRPNEAGVFVPA